MTQSPRRGCASSPRVRLVLARVVVAIGGLLAVIALVTARWGLLFAAVIVVGLGAALGPARIRRD
jgi:hypothetical protein